MAQTQQVELISDLDGGRAAETVSFGLDGTAYEIDLSAEQAEEMREALSAYTEAASRKRKAPGQRKRRKGAEPPGLREYAASRGFEVRDGWAVPGRIRDEFELLVKIGVVRPAEA
jgi:hypothetical protein